MLLRGPKFGPAIPFEVGESTFIDICFSRLRHQLNVGQLDVVLSCGVHSSAWIHIFSPLLCCVMFQVQVKAFEV